MAPIAINLAPDQRTIDPDSILRDLITKGLIVFTQDQRNPEVTESIIGLNGMTLSVFKAKCTLICTELVIRIYTGINSIIDLFFFL